MKYGLELPLNDEYSLLGQLEKRCKRLPKDATIPYFIRALNMDATYRASKARKTKIEEAEYTF